MAHVFFLNHGASSKLDININQLSNEKKPGCLVYIRDFTTQLCRDYNKPL